MSYKHEYISFKNEAEWLSLRNKDLTSTQISALFGLCPYHTEFELYHAKRDGIELPFSPNDHVYKGNRLESFLAEEIALRNGWEVKPFKVYGRLPDLRIGSSFDYEVFIKDPYKDEKTGKEYSGKGLLEIKGIGHNQNYKWLDDEIPPHIEIQVQNELLCSPEHKWGIVGKGVYVMDNPDLYFFDSDSEFQEGLVRASKRFWNSVDKGMEPEADFERDGRMISELYKNVSEDSVDLTSDERILDAIVELNVLKEQESSAKKKIDALKNEIHQKIGSHGKALVKGGYVDAAWTNGSSGTIVTESMVGSVINAKKGFRKLIWKHNKEKK